MKTYIFEGVQNYGLPQNWGKFLVGIPDVEWARQSEIGAAGVGSRLALLQQIGWTPEHVWVFDLQTGEGAMFRPHPGGLPRADLEKHRIWVCPLFEEFLKWLYKQDMEKLHLLPRVVELPDAQFSITGYRRLGPTDVAFGLKPGDCLRIEWGGEIRDVICESLDDTGALIRGLTEEESQRLAEQSYTEDDPEKIWANDMPAEHPYPERSFGSWSEKVDAEMARQAADETKVLSPDDQPTQIIGGNGSSDGA